MLTSAHLVDVILFFAALEGVFLVVAKGWKPRSACLLLLPGMFLMLALRSALAAAAWPWVPVFLLGSLISHIADVRLRTPG